MLLAACCVIGLHTHAHLHIICRRRILLPHTMAVEAAALRTACICMSRVCRGVETDPTTIITLMLRGTLSEGVHRSYDLNMPTTCTRPAAVKTTIRVHRAEPTRAIQPAHLWPLVRMRIATPLLCGRPASLTCRYRARLYDTSHPFPYLPLPTNIGECPRRPNEGD